jgi:UDP-N-acetylmuramyl tripeptide synthase
MIEMLAHSGETAPAIRAESIREWRQITLGANLLPVIMVAGSRGKTTVCRLLEAMIGEQFRIATRDPSGVRIDGELQEGEIEPWTRVEQMLRNGQLDLAIWELDWPTAATLPPTHHYALLAVTNVCANREECMIWGDARMALRTLPVLARTLPERGMLVLNGDDQVVADLRELHPFRTLLAGHGIESPAMEEQWNSGGACAWIDSGHLCAGQAGAAVRLARVSDIAFALGGVASFEIENALVAAAIAHGIGVRASAIGAALRTFRCDPRSMPGSFNVISSSGTPVIIDRPAPSWYLRPVLRAVRDFRQARLITVVGRLTTTPEEDYAEVGRLLGRISSALLIATGRAVDGYPWGVIRDGALRNEVPPVVLPVATEQAAFRKAVAMARPADTIFCLAEAPEQLMQAWPSRMVLPAEHASANGKTHQ